LALAYASGSLWVQNADLGKARENSGKAEPKIGWKNLPPCRRNHFFSRAEEKISRAEDFSSLF